ncbi:hypothetical protein BN1708_010433, partial [Verticillium longisporum]
PDLSAASLSAAAIRRHTSQYHSPDAWRVTRDDTICCWACQRGPVAAARAALSDNGTKASNVDP